MHTYLSLLFLQKKINELQTALFFNLSTSVLKTATSIINILKTDEAGQVWFLMVPPEQSLNEFDQSFPSELQFFRKGKSFYLKITGKAFIVTDPEEINTIFWADDEIKKQAITGKIMLMKVKIQYADYFEKKERAEKKELKNILAQFYSKLFEPYHSNHETYRIIQEHVG